MTGRELDQLNDEVLAATIDKICVYARVSPVHKLRVVRAWKSRGHVVAMTGDGVNDAPAIEAADIGIAMGLSGTDVTKEASDMVLTDDNFASIVSAVEEGRAIYDNVQKFILYLLSSNLSEVLFVLFAALAGWPLPLIAIQLLWINLMTDGLPALALGMEKPEPDVMRRPPRAPHEPVITPRRGLLMLSYGAVMAAVTAVAFGVDYHGASEDLSRSRTVAFCVLAFSQLFFAVGCRSQRYTMPQLGLFSNPYLFWAIAVSALLQVAVVVLPPLAYVFRTSSLNARSWLAVLALTLLPATVIEVAKIVARPALRGRR